MPLPSDIEDVKLKKMNSAWKAHLKMLKKGFNLERKIVNKLGEILVELEDYIPASKLRKVIKLLL